MEDNNRLAIIRHVQIELEMHATDGAFDEVSWRCIYEQQQDCRYMHRHGKAHDLASKIAKNANGVFLWVALVMEAVSRHVVSGCPVSVLNCYVDKIPTELKEYFRNMIFKRIHESMLSETAMALSIALRKDRQASVCHFALLCNYMDSGESWLTDPGFASNLPCVTTTPDEAEKIAQKTHAFLRGCCRDLLVVSNRWDHLIYKPVDFTHRTVFDYLRTPEMQVLLNKHAPDHFQDALFQDKLDVAACKFLVLDPYDPVCTSRGWFQLASCAGGLLRWDNPQTFKTETFHSRKAVELAQTLEKVSLYQLWAVQRLLRTIFRESHEESQQICTCLSIRLAMCGLFELTDNLIDVAPQLLCSIIPSMCNDMASLMFQPRYHDMAFDTAILRRLLQAGLDPNLAFTCGLDPGWTSLWTNFMKQIVKHKYIILAPEHRWHGFWDSLPQFTIDESDTAGRDEIHVTSCVHDAIKTFIEFGAKLEPDDVEMLESGLPKPGGIGFDWPQFFNTYSQPAKRIELDEDRRERLRRRPENWLSEKDWKLLDPAPDLSEEWWSDRGRRLLGLM
jgi:hypothetical protein